jgi:hypothetical protein
MVLIAAAMIWRRRSKHSFVVVAGAVLHASGLILQASTQPIAFKPSSNGGGLPQYAGLGDGWQLGYDLTTVGSLLFLAGLLWYFLSLREASAEKTS